MPWKLIAFLAILLAITFFIGFNLDNRCDVSFVFHIYRNVPIFVSLLFAYLAGAITVIPFFLGRRSRPGKREKGSGTASSIAGHDDGLGARSAPSRGKKRNVSGKHVRDREAERSRSGHSTEYGID